MEEQFNEFLIINKPSVEDPCMLSNAVKGFVKDKSIAFALENKIAVLEQNMPSNTTSDLILQRELLTKYLNQLLRHRANFLIHRTRQNVHLNSAQPSHFLDFKHCVNG